MQEAFKGSQIEMVAGSKGVFDVVVDDTLVYSKAITNQFPDEEMLIEELFAKYKV